MKKTIWKYSLPQQVSFLEMPKGAEILTVQPQNGVPCIWAIVDPDAPLEDRVFVSVTTGGYVPVNSNPKYIGTYQLYDQQLVLHLFESTTSNEKQNNQTQN